MSSRETTAQTWKVIAGDTITGMATLPEASVHACITSPPYWGLRDYGTASWEGGDASCNHTGKPMATKANINRNCGTGVDRKNATAMEFFRETCGKCGAERIDQQIGLESTPAEYVARMVEVFRAVRRVLRDDGTCWVNLGDSYTAGAGNRNGMNESTLRGKTYGRGCMGDKPMSGLDAGVRPKNLIGIPWRVAFALQDDGWYLRQDIIWHKPNPMPESVTDRCTKAHEYIFLLAKSAKYHFDSKSISEPAAFAGQQRGGSTNRYEQNAAGMDNKIYDTRNKRSVWTVCTEPYPGAHFATFPTALIEPCVKAGCPVGGTVLDPFNGSGTTGVVALKQGRSYVGCELNPEYVAMSRRRLADVAPLLAQEVA